MVNAKNLTLDRTLKIKGQTIPPGGQALLKCSESEIKQHLFVRTGCLHIESSAPKPQGNGGGDKASALKAEIAESIDIERLEALLDDSRKTVSEAAAKRLEELEAESAGDDSSEEGDGEQPEE